VGSTFGTGTGRGLFGRAFATRDLVGDAGRSGAPSHRLLLTLTVACFAALLLAPAAQAGKVPGFGVLGTGTAGAGNGQLGTILRGMAVSTTGAGGATAGDVYVSDTTNNRISQFSGSGTFIRAFGVDVVTSGGVDNANEVQRVAVKATAGTFRLTFGATGTKTTGASGTGDTTESSTTIENVATATGAFLQGEAIAGPGIPAGTTIASVGAGTLTLSQAATATATGVALTADLPYNSSAALLQSALNALTTINTGGGSVVVTGGPGNETGAAPYVVTFSGAPLKGTDVAQMTSASGFLALSGGSGSGANEAKVITSNAGNTGFEICNATGNTCKAGLASGAAGGLAVAMGIALDPATGNVFVPTDGAAGNAGKRVNVYSATGQFLGAFGWNVNAAAPEAKLQLCTFATNCAAGASGAGAGQLGALGGNTQSGQQGPSPAVSPVNGHLFVPEPANRRIDEFSFTYSGGELTGVSLVKAFGGDVTPTVNENQTVTLTGATGGTFALSFNGKSTDVTGTGDLEAGSSEVTNFKVADGAFVVGEEISGPGLPAGTKITAVTFDSLTLTNSATAGATGATLGASLPFNASKETVQGALASLSSIGTGNVTVPTGPNGGPYTLEFSGSLAGTDVTQVTADGSDLTGSTPSVAVATTQVGANGAGTGFETCTVATACKAGAGGSEAGTFVTQSPSSLAIDSTGSIYATGQPGATVCNAGCRVQKFNSSATSAEDFAPATLSSTEASTTVGVAPKLVAVDPINDHVLVAKRISASSFKIYEFTRSGSFIDASPPAEAGLPTEGAGGPRAFAVGTAERAYLVQGSALARILGNPAPPKASVESPVGVTKTSATFTGVAQPSPPGTEGGFATSTWFEYSSDGISWTATDPVEIGTGTGAGNPNSCPTGNPPACNISQLVGGLKGGTTYLVRLVVSNGTKATSTTVNFTTAAAGPGIGGLGATDVTQTSASLNGDIDPNGEVTSYHFEWGPTTAYGTRVPADLEAIAGGGSRPIPVSIQISGLQPETSYHYRIVAKSSSGTTTSPDQELMTLNAAGLPGGRGFELVSPPNKRPVGTTLPFVFSIQARFRAAEKGDGISYSISYGTKDSTAGGDLVHASHRTPSGWVASQVAAPALLSSPNPGQLTPPAGWVRSIASDLQCAVVESPNPLSQETPQVDIENGVTHLYLWNADDDSYTLITNRSPLNPAAAQPLEGFYSVPGISSDCSRVFFYSVAYSFFPGATKLYEWDSGTLREAGLRPDSSSPGSVGDRVAQDPYTVSRNGRLFFTAASNELKDSGKQAVFVRKGSGQVVNASSPTTGGTPSQGATYEAASPDGSHVFFLADYGIASTSSAGPQDDSCVFTSAGAPSLGNVAACDLYDYDVETGALTDISATTDPANPRGAVVQGVLDVSENGEVVYFAARGQLLPGEGRTYAQNSLGGGFANVYRYEGGDLSYVGSIGMSQAMFPSDYTQIKALTRNEGASASQTTKSGDYLLFPSRANMAGENPNEVVQVYLYSALTGETECVSCPVGRAPEEEARIVTNNYLNGVNSGDGNYQPRSLSEDGRVFFTSTEPLVAGATQGNSSSTFESFSTTNAYEWHRGQLSLLMSGRLKLIDISNDGKDVYVNTNEQLVPQDIDFAADIYDVRTGGGFAAPPTVASCDPAADQCQGTPGTPPSAPTPPSAGFTGPGSSPEKATKPKPKQCPKGKVRKHGKCVKKPVKKKKQKAKAQSKRAADNNRGGAK